MKQTAVEWLESQINIWQAIATDETNLTLDTVIKLLQQAKAMEKKQIIDAYSEGQNTPYEYSEDNEINWYDGKQYYNETFKSE